MFGLPCRMLFKGLPSPLDPGPGKAANLRAVVADRSLAPQDLLHDRDIVAEAHSAFPRAARTSLRRSGGPKPRARASCARHPPSRRWSERTSRGWPARAPRAARRTYRGESFSFSAAMYASGVIASELYVSDVHTASKPSSSARRMRLIGSSNVAPAYDRAFNRSATSPCRLDPAEPRPVATARTCARIIARSPP